MLPLSSTVFLISFSVDFRSKNVNVKNIERGKFNQFSFYVKIWQDCRVSWHQYKCNRNSAFEIFVEAHPDTSISRPEHNGSMRTSIENICCWSWPYVVLSISTVLAVNLSEGVRTRERNVTNENRGKSLMICVLAAGRYFWFVLTNVPWRLEVGWGR